MKLHTLFLILLVSTAAYTQCTQCGGSRVDIQFSTATLTDTNGIDSTITGEFIYQLDFKNSTCKYFKDGVLQWKRMGKFQFIVVTLEEIKIQIN